MKNLEELANEYANKISTGGRVLVSMYLGQREFSTVTEIVKVAFIDGYNARQAQVDSKEN